MHQTFLHFVLLLVDTVGVFVALWMGFALVEWTSGLFPTALLPAGRAEFCRLRILSGRRKVIQTSAEGIPHRLESFLLRMLRLTRFFPGIECLESPSTEKERISRSGLFLTSTTFFCQRAALSRIFCAPILRKCMSSADTTTSRDTAASRTVSFLIAETGLDRVRKNCAGQIC